VERGQQQQKEWQDRLEAFRQDYPKEARQMEMDLSGDLPEDWDSELAGLLWDEDTPMATREALGQVINTISTRLHGLVGGAADLAPSTKTIIKEKGHFGPENYRGHNLHYGVREHAMGAIANGMAIHRGVIPYTATFLIFYDYMRPPVRLAALMEQRVIFIFTHDSVGLGEDGPTHQPVEQIAGMRAVPNLVVIRPADAIETAEAWQIALERRHGPTALLLTRQKLPMLDRLGLALDGGVKHGGYTIWQASPTPDVILIGTGSEVHIALEAGQLLGGSGIAARVVSLPSWELFDIQSVEYRDSILPQQVKARVSVEAAATFGWERYVGIDGIALGLDRFGVSAPYKTIYQKLGLTAARMADEARKLLQQKG
jgi:transketolase